LLGSANSRFPDARFQLGDMVDLNLPNDRFDVVFSLASFHHVSGPGPRQKCVEEIRRVLRNEGLLILSVWNLYQWRFLRQWLISFLSFIFHLGLRYGWNDLWVPWRNNGPKRYFHAFLPKELLGYFGKDQWTIEEFYFLRKGSRVKFWKSWNLCLVARKTHG
jgi:SAM-dependent methyltransferase